MATKDLEKHAAEWDSVARGYEDSAEAEAAFGRYRGVYDSKARLAHRTAESLRLQARTGQPHCACCLKPRCSKGVK